MNRVKPTRINPRSSVQKGVAALLLLLTVACGPIAAPEIVAVTPLPAGALVAATTTTPQPATTDVPAVVETTPTPLNVQLAQGSAAAVAAATDVVLQPTPRTRLSFDSHPVSLTFDEFYDGYNMRTGLILSDKLVSLDGQDVVIEGYMAPPLKAELDWFVLTRIRLEFCPFCSTAASWPDDIALIYLKDGVIPVTTAPLRLEGRLEVGASVDPETGMVSVVRIYADKVEPLS
jgi:hypothetical protein